MRIKPKAKTDKPSPDDVRDSIGQAIGFLEMRHYPAAVAALAHAIRQIVAIQNAPEALPKFKE